MTEEKATEPTAGGLGPDKGAREKGSQPRDKWANKVEFLCSMAGGVVGFQDLWSFPYLCYRNGGVAFFIPYFVILFFFGFPLFMLETTLGQYTSEGGVTAWRKICPMFEGIGIASQLVVSLLSICYIMVLVWVIMYLVYAFKSPLPWSRCNNWWNTVPCQSQSMMFADPQMLGTDSNDWSFLNNLTSTEYYNYTEFYNQTIPMDTESLPEVQFWRNRFIRIPEESFLGDLNIDQALCLLAVWTICYFCIWKGIKITGKLTYFTSTFPYLMLVIFFFRGVTLPGAADGLKYFLYPNFQKIADLRTWTDAATHVTFSYTMSLGILTSLGSYNKYNNDCYRDCLALCGLKAGTSIFSGFVVWSVVGFMAHVLETNVEDVVASSPELSFITFPAALALMPSSRFWAVSFFVMLFFQGLDNHFLGMLSLVTAITDMFPHHLRRPKAREILVLVLVVVFFLLGLLLVTEGGIFIFSLLDQFGCSTHFCLIIVCLESVVIAWVYGADRFYDNIEDMIGYRPFPVLKYCWLFITPLLCGLTFLYNLLNSYMVLMYNYSPGKWEAVFGSILVGTPLMCIPVFILVTLFRKPENMTTPSSDLRQARPHKPLLTLCKCVVFKAQGSRSGTAGERCDKMMMEEPSGV